MFIGGIGPTPWFGGQVDELRIWDSPRTEAEIHVQALEELGLSLESEIAPQIIELEDRTITLTGSVEDQYQQWRELLRQIYEAEVGEPLPLPSGGET